MSKTTTDHSELRAESIRHWQKVGELSRAIGYLICLAKTTPRVESPLRALATLLQCERLRVDTDYHEWRDKYLADNPDAAKKYKREQAGKPNRK